MKKISMLILVLLIVFSTIPISYAADEGGVVSTLNRAITGFWQGAGAILDNDFVKNNPFIVFRVFFFFATVTVVFASLSRLGFLTRGQAIVLAIGLGLLTVVLSPESIYKLGSFYLMFLLSFILLAPFIAVIMAVNAMDLSSMNLGKWIFGLVLICLLIGIATYIGSITAHFVNEFAKFGAAGSVPR